MKKNRRRNEKKTLYKQYKCVGGKQTGPKEVVSYLFSISDGKNESLNWSETRKISYIYDLCDIFYFNFKWTIYFSYIIIFIGN